MSAKEQKLRRILRKMDLQLCKSRARNWSYDNQLGYMIIDVYTNAVVRGSRFNLTLEDVEAFIAG